MARETLIQIRQGSYSGWGTANPVLAIGELGVITDDYTVKIGDGSTSFNSILGSLPNTSFNNIFYSGQRIYPRVTNAIGLDVKSGMRYALILSALVASNGAQITYTYATNGSGLSGGLISVGDYVTISGFSNSMYNYTSVVVTGVTLGTYPTFTISGSGTPSASASGTGSTWFFETPVSMSDAFRVSNLGPGGGANSTQTNTAFRVTGFGNTVVSNTLTVGSTLSVNSNISVAGDFSSDITFSGTTLGLRLNSATYNTTSRITATATNSQTGTAMLESKAAGTGTYYHQFFSDTGGVAGWIKTVSGVPSIVASSDYRRKENIVPIEDAVEKVKALKPSRFNFKHVPGATVDGFIAHEVAEIVPTAVDGEKDAVDEDGNPVYQGLDASKLIPILTAALQDALKRIEVLEKKVK